MERIIRLGGDAKKVLGFENYYQKIDAPPHTKVRGLNGARFLDAQSVPHTKVCGLSNTLTSIKYWEAHK